MQHNHGTSTSVRYATNSILWEAGQVRTIPKNARAAAPFMEAMLTTPAPVLEALAEVLVDVPVLLLAAPEF